MGDTQFPHGLVPRFGLMRFTGDHRAGYHDFSASINNGSAGELVGQVRRAPVRRDDKLQSNFSPYCL